MQGELSMAKVINLDRIRIENFQIFALADEGRSYPVWTLAVNYTMIGSNGERLAGSKTFDLTTQQQVQMRQFLVSFVSNLKVETNITEVENWIQAF
jgi:putative alpha-1,2-mannosidase